MPRLPDLDSLGSRPVPVSRRGIASNPRAGIVGDAVAGLGGQIANIGIRQLDGQAARQGAEATSYLTREKIKLDAEFAADRDFATQADRYAERLRSINEAASKMISQPRVREAFEQEASITFERGIAETKQRARAGTADAAVAGYTELSTANMQAALQTPDIKDAVSLLSANQTALRGLQEQGYISAQDAATKNREMLDHFGIERIKLLPPDEQVALLKPYHGKAAPIGTLPGMIPVEARGVLLEKAETEVRVEAARALVEANRQKTEAEQADKEREDTVANLIGSGVIVDDGQIGAAVQTAIARGDTSKAIQLRGKQHANNAMRVFADASVPQVTERLSQIEGTKGWRENIDLVMEHDALGRLRTSKANAPANYSALDIADPKSVEARRQQAYTRARELGQVAPDFWGQDLGRLKDLYDQGPAGRAEVAAFASAFGKDAVAAARQIAPNDKVLWIASSISDQSNRQLALEGRDALKANPELNPLNGDVAQKYWNRQASMAMSGVPQDYALAVRYTAQSIAAANLARDGISKPTSSQYEDALAEGMQIAVGRNVSGGIQRGGFGEWRGKPIILPATMSQDEFDRRLSQLDKVNGFLWSNGRPISADQLRTQFIPVKVGPTTYQFRDAYGNPAIKADKTPAIMDVGGIRLDPRAPPPTKKREPMQPRQGRDY